MRAARVVTLDGPSAVEVGDVDEPQPSGGQVVIDVEYAGLTYPTCCSPAGSTRSNRHRRSSPALRWLVVRSAPRTDRASPKVIGSPPSPALGGFAQVVSADPAWCSRLPDSVALDAAAGLPMNYSPSTSPRCAAADCSPKRQCSCTVRLAASGLRPPGLQKALGATVIAVKSDERGGRGPAGRGGHGGAR